MLTAGSSPPLASYEAEESAAPGLLSLVSDLASTTAASLLGRARSYVPGPAASAGRSLFGGLRRGGGSGSGDGTANGGDAQQQQQQGAAAKKREKILGEPASLRGVVWDEQRCITQLALAPTCVCCCPAPAVAALRRRFSVAAGMLCACCAAFFVGLRHTAPDESTVTARLAKFPLHLLCCDVAVAG
jgi:hypothetical protein